MENKERALSQKEIFLFKYINQNRDNLKNNTELLNFITNSLLFIGIPENKSKYYLNLYLQNYRPKGDYENIDKSSFIDVSAFKQKKTTNKNAYTFTSEKMPFKGSNLEGYWDYNQNNDRYYIVLSYGWYPIYLYIKDKWFRVTNNYSNTTAKQMRYSDPTHYDSGLNDKVIYVTREEIQDLRRGTDIEEIYLNRVTNFIQTKSENMIGKSNFVTSFLEDIDDRIKIFYKITNIQTEDNKIVISITIDKVGKMEGRKFIIEPNGYIHPSPFSNSIEEILKNAIYTKYLDYLSEENTKFIFNHL